MPHTASAAYSSGDHPIGAAWRAPQWRMRPHARIQSRAWRNRSPTRPTRRLLVAEPALPPRCPCADHRLPAHHRRRRRGAGARPSSPVDRRGDARPRQRRRLRHRAVRSRMAAAEGGDVTQTRSARTRAVDPRHGARPPRPAQQHRRHHHRRGEPSGGPIGSRVDRHPRRRSSQLTILGASAGVLEARACPAAGARASSPCAASPIPAAC